MGRKFAHWSALLASVLALTGCQADSWFAGGYNAVDVRDTLTLPAVEWERADGTKFDVHRETARHPTLLFFGYTHCPDICPMQLMNIASALRALGPDTAKMVRVLVVTIDPARDTGVVLTRWLRAIDPAFIELRGPITTVNREIARLGLAPPPRAGGTATGLDPDHASTVLGFAADGYARFQAPPNLNANAWVHDLRTLIGDRRAPAAR